MIRSVSFIFLPLALVSCVSPPGPLEMTTDEYMKAVDGPPVTGRFVKMDFRVHVSSGKFPAREEQDEEIMPSIVARYGQASKIEIIRESIYPTSYDPAAAAEDPVMFPVTPANPTVFEMKPVGWTIEAKASRKGPFIALKGEVRFVEETGVSRVAAGAGPLMTPDGKRIVVTENLIQFPRFGEFRTPFTLLMLPGKTYTFEISHPVKGTKIDVVATPYTSG